MGTTDEQQGLEHIRTISSPFCALCGKEGHGLYANLEDRLYSTAGSWSLRACPSDGCGLIWLDPRPIDEDIGKTYASYYTHSEPDRPVLTSRMATVYNAVASSYVAHRFGYSQGTAHRWLWPLMYLHPGARDEADGSVSHQRLPTKGARLLDVGCGDGSQLATMQELGWTVEGIEIDSRAVEAALRRGLPVRLGTLGSDSYPTGSFDVVSVRHVIEHVPDPIELLRQCHRVLKADGALVVMTPNAGSLGHRLFRDAWLPLDPPRHLYLFDNLTLSAVLHQSAAWNVQSLFSTLRGSGPDLWASIDLRRRGRHRLTRVFDKSVPAQLIIHLLYGFEWLMGKFDPWAGEELCLIARKMVVV